MANETYESNALRVIKDTENRLKTASPTRGVSYPFISLVEALEAAKKIYAAERKTAAPVASAISHLGYAESSSGGRQTISALLQFGLLEDEGRKDDRLVRLTSRALDIMLSEEGSETQRSALIECVKSPKIYKDIFLRWTDELPSDQTISFFLQRDKNFNPKAIKSFIKDLRTSMSFVGVQHPRDLDGPLQSTDESVNLTSNAASHVDSIFLQSAPNAPKAANALMIDHYRPNLAPHEKEWMKGSLSKNTEFRLLISGEIEAKQIGRLIRLLEAQREVLMDDDDVDEP
jgi:hypothetical protein